MWVALLFSILSISEFLQLSEPGISIGSTVEPVSMLETYRILTVQCLLVGKYLISTKYTLETLCLYFFIEQNSTTDIIAENWYLVGVIVRVAMHMGLHRDPSHWPHIRPLHAEIRRRLWLVFYQIDFFTSAHNGLPRIIKDSQCDSRAPLHLFEDDLNPELITMPPERPSTEPSEIFYLLQRNVLVKIAAEIYDTTEGSAPSCATIAILSQKLEKIVATIPAWLRHKPIEEAISDKPVIILNRIFLDMILQKAIYLLHRRSFVKSSDDEESAKSNDQCINAALAILHHQRSMTEETRPGGLLAGSRWKVTTALNHEFLQATMMLCFALSRLHEGSLVAVTSRALLRRDEMLQALRAAKDIWEMILEESMEAQRAVQTITVVLKQTLDERRPPRATEFPGKIYPTMVGLLTNKIRSADYSDPLLHAPSQNYFSDFDLGNYMSLDPSLVTIDDDVIAFGNLVDGFAIQSQDDILSKGSIVRPSFPQQSYLSDFS
ncbi:hypothetical protein MMC25_004110 [Agyrium rufum]|nr:hypothetical protein [Agyrium rufum]